MVGKVYLPLKSNSAAWVFVRNSMFTCPPAAVGICNWQIEESQYINIFSHQVIHRAVLLRTFSTRLYIVAIWSRSSSFRNSSLSTLSSPSPKWEDEVSTISSAGSSPIWCSSFDDNVFTLIADLFRDGLLPALSSPMTADGLVVPGNSMLTIAIWEEASPGAWFGSELLTGVFEEEDLSTSDKIQEAHSEDIKGCSKMVFSVEASVHKSCAHPQYGLLVLLEVRMNAMLVFGDKIVNCPDLGKVGDGVPSPPPDILRASNRPPSCEACACSKRSSLK